MKTLDWKQVFLNNIISVRILFILIICYKKFCFRYTSVFVFSNGCLIIEQVNKLQNSFIQSKLWVYLKETYVLTFKINYVFIICNIVKLKTGNSCFKRRRNKYIKTGIIIVTHVANTQIWRALFFDCIIRRKKVITQNNYIKEKKSTK